MLKQLDQLNQRYSRIIQIGAAVAAGALLTATALKPQIPPVGPVWEFSTVSSSVDISGVATICYAAAFGCRNEQVKPINNQGTETLMMAAAALGEKGWELAAATGESNNSRSVRVLYFRRLKSVLNRSDSPGAR